VESAPSTRRITPDDAEIILADLRTGFDSYVSFAGSDWTPPDMSAERERIVQVLQGETTWGLVAEIDGRAVGHVGFFAGRERSPGEGASRSKRPLIPGLAHLWQLFVLPDWWGRGVAATLHDGAVEAMGAQGYEHARLFTPSLHARARRFYEKRGWRTVQEEWNEFLALMVAEYRRTL
jgi:GNAT superfamily N-acetyltransferase